MRGQGLIWLPHDAAQYLPSAQPAEAQPMSAGQAAGPAADYLGAEERESQHLTARTDFHGPVHAPGSVFGISLRGR